MLRRGIRRVSGKLDSPGQVPVLKIPTLILGLAPNISGPFGAVGEPERAAHPGVMASDGFSDRYGDLLTSP